MPCTEGGTKAGEPRHVFWSDMQCADGQTGVGEDEYVSCSNHQCESGRTRVGECRSVSWLGQEHLCFPPPFFNHMHTDGWTMVHYTLIHIPSAMLVSQCPLWPFRSNSSDPTRCRLVHEIWKILRRRPMSAAHELWEILPIGWPINDVSHRRSLCESPARPRCTVLQHGLPRRPYRIMWWIGFAQSVQFYWDISHRSLCCSSCRRVDLARLL